MGNEIFIEKQEGMSKIAKEQTRSNSEATTTKDTQRMQKFCRCSEFSQCVLPILAKTAKTHV